MTKRRKTPLEFERIEPQLCSVDLRMAILRKVPFFRNLEEAEIAQINKKFVERGYSSGETIFFTGDTAERLYVVADGNITLKQHTLMGQDVLLDVLKPGDFFGRLAFLGDQGHSETAVAQTPCCVLSVGVDDFRSILQDHPRVAIQVIDIMTERLNAAHEMIRQLSKHSVEQRIAYVLLKLAEKVGEEKDVGLLIQLPLSRADLAEMVGTTTETASRVISQFQKEGLVRTGRLWIAIADQKGLLNYKEGSVTTLAP